MSSVNIVINNNQEDKLNSPYHISDIKMEILKKLGLDYILFEKIKKLEVLDNKIKFYKIFRHEIESEIELFFNIINLEYEDKDLDINDKIIVEHVNNLNNLMDIIFKMLN